MIGDSPGALVDSNILENVNEPCDAEKFSWVRPGVCFWDWRAWGHVAGDFTWQLGLESWKRFVDLASETGVPYLLLDANWYGQEFNTKSDPLKGGKVLDVHKLVAYAKEKNVAIIVYLNDAITKNFDVEEVLSAYNRWGIKGIKYGFMRGDKLTKTQRVIELCAKYKLLCNFHDGPLPPTGDYVAWPCCVTREYCHAQSDAKKAFVPKTFTTTVFVNNLCGPIDMDNGMFDLNNSKKQRPKVFAEVPSTIVAEAARTLIVFSGLVVVPDSADSYRRHLDLFRFISAQKMPWKQSVTLAGEIGKYIVTAREAADGTWLLAAATNEEGRKLDIPLKFLGEGKYSAAIFEDAPDAHYKTNREAYGKRSRDVSGSDTVEAKLAPGGGFCAIFKKAQSAGDPFLGLYAGKFSVVSTIDAEGQVKSRPKCGSCHARAAVTRFNGKYRLTLTIERAKGNKVIRFDSEGQGDRVLFKNGPFTITAENGRITGERKGKVNAKIEMGLDRKPAK
jgi:alpha-glucosidase